jgi:hypothetical protein
MQGSGPRRCGVSSATPQVCPRESAGGGMHAGIASQAGLHERAGLPVLGPLFAMGKGACARAGRCAAARRSHTLAVLRRLQHATAPRVLRGLAFLLLANAALPTADQDLDALETFAGQAACTHAFRSGGRRAIAYESWP